MREKPDSKPPDIDKDLELLRREAERYRRELKAGTLAPEDLLPEDHEFWAKVDGYGELCLDELARLVRVLRELERKGKARA